MNIGYFRAEVRTEGGALPVAGATVIVMDDGQELYSLLTGEDGNTRTVELSAPPKDNSLSSTGEGPFYSTYDIKVIKPGFITVEVRRVQVYDTITSILPVRISPAPDGVESPSEIIELPKQAIELRTGWEQHGPMLQPRNPREFEQPDSITVHMGRYDEEAPNVTLPFAEYVKNAAASAVFPTWPEAALEANIYCAVTFALNRIYTGWYRNRGLDFDITCMPDTDQAFIQGRSTFANTDELAGRLIHSYVRRAGCGEPYFTDFCNGTTVTCPGLSQWGTLTLANHGMDSLSILRFYYPRDVEIATCGKKMEAKGTIADEATPVTGPPVGPPRYPGALFRPGVKGDSIWLIQSYLNFISEKYPSIPGIEQDGIYGPATQQALSAYQKLFGLVQDGILNHETWGSVVEVYAIVGGNY